MLPGILLMLAMQAPSIQTIVADMMSQIESPKQAVARTPVEWTKLWREHAGETPVPKIDFGSRTVVAVFLGTRSSAGYLVEITGTRLDQGALVVEWRERRPERDQVSAQVITSPAHIATIPKFAGDIRFEQVGR
jgi:hypothetical protein